MISLPLLDQRSRAVAGAIIHHDNLHKGRRARAQITDH